MKDLRLPDGKSAHLHEGSLAPVDLRHVGECFFMEQVCVWWASVCVCDYIC